MCRVFTGLTVNENTVLNPKVREFWEKISGLIIPQTEGGCLDIFLPLAASGESRCVMMNPIHRERAILFDIKHFN